ncbi:MAG: saccharopine dehydrogenase family protein [Bacteroidia bacterium]
MKNVIILGAGLIGKTMAIDLAAKYKVTCADIRQESLNDFPPRLKISTTVCDFTHKKKLAELLQPFDLVILAVPGFMGFDTLKTVIEAGKNVVDISFFPEDPFKLNELAVKKNVAAIVDCGVAPGMCNIIAGYHNERMKMLKYECMVGGLPFKREWPFEYKAVFSPIDVLEEYTRPARYIKNGKEVVKVALDEIEKVVLDGAGELEAFDTDGLRTLAVTLKGVPDMKEKTLRYPGHAELMKIFRETGLFGKEPVVVEGTSVIPLHVTAKLLFPKWKLKPGEEDFTVMRVVIGGEKEEFVYTLFDRFDTKSNTTSMARTTGYTCTAAASLMLEGKFSKKGVFAPEHIGADESLFNYILEYLSERNVNYTKKVIAKNKAITI